MPFGLRSNEPVRFEVNPAGMNEILRGESGPTIRYLMQKGHRAKEIAQRKVGVSEPDPVPRAKPKPRPGILRDSINVRLGYVGAEPAVFLGVFSGPATAYATFHHEGTQPHVIMPRTQRGPVRIAKTTGVADRRYNKPLATHLVFWSGRAGRVVYAKKVRHPGTRPNRFLTEAVREAF